MPFPREKIDALASKVDGLGARVDAFFARRKARDDAKAKAKKDAFEDASHPRNAGGTFVPASGTEGEEKGDTQIEPGSLSKRNIETR